VAIAAEGTVAGEDQIAEPGKTAHGLRLGAKPGGKTSHFGEAAGDQCGQ
jgi:hypothetical protein